jgi:MoxR-like ATPase
MKNFELKRHIEQADDPEVLKQTLFALLDKIDSLEQRLSGVGEKEGGEGVSNIIERKRERLDRIRHGLTELNERMQKPYVISAELEAVKEVLDVLSEVGECNSVILEGEPGTGKTQWAYSEVGQELQDGKDVSLVHVRVKDTMRAQDLLYSIDDVRRLSDTQAQAQVPDEIRQEAAEWKQKIVSGEVNPSEDGEYKAFKAKMEAVVELGETAKDLDYLNYVDLGPLGEAIYQSGKGQKVYLVIDEIEKGREELMTGILDEIENLTFTVGETGTVIKGDKKNLRIVITTNTEDSDKIPPSFRRRSLYHFIDYPSRADMAQIVELNFPDIQKELLDYAISVFYQYHENSEIEKKPSTPELLAWIRVLSKNFDGSIPDDVPHKEILLKYQEDQEFDIGKIYNIDNIYKSSENENKLNSRQFSLNFEQRVDLYKIFYQYLDGFEINQGDMFNIEREEDYDNGDYYVIELSAKNEDDNFAWTTQEEVTRMIDRILGYSNY